MVDSKTEAFNDIAKAIAGTVIARFLCIFQAISVFRFFLFPTWKFSSCCCYFNWFLTATASRIIHSPHEVESIASKCLDLFEKIVDTHTLCRAQTACTEEKWEQQRETRVKNGILFLDSWTETIRESDYIMLLSIFQCGALWYPKQTENPTNQLTIVLDIYAKRVAFCLELFTSFDSLHECFSNSILDWDVKRNGRGIYYSIILAHLYCDSHADFFWSFDLYGKQDNHRILRFMRTISKERCGILPFWHWWDGNFKWFQHIWFSRDLIIHSKVALTREIRFFFGETLS